MKPVRYHIRHDTHYHYGQPVGESHQLLRLRPRDLVGQQCIAHHTSVVPVPSSENRFLDSFGNWVQVLHFEASHDSLSVRSESWVELQASAPVAPSSHSISIATAREALRYRAGRQLDEAFLSAAPFCFESAHVPVQETFEHFARAFLSPDTPLLLGVEGLMQHIYEHFTFDPTATEVSTPVYEVLASRRGVCQDFAHLMIACLRSTGLAARYVSGYLLTRPPAGRPRMIGADATHAWVSVFCPGQGWIDFDPTNAIRPGLEHITIGWGRDFSDISPMRGVIRGGGEHEPDIAVTVTPEEEFTALYTDAELPALDFNGAS